MAESLGEAFVEVLADTSPFGDSLAEGISDALDGIPDEVSAALDGVGPAAEAAMQEIPEEARSAADETVEAFDGVADDVNAALDGISFDRIAEGIQENLGKITLAAAGAAAGAEGLARSQQDLRLGTATLARQTGMTEGEVNELARSLSNATFPLDDVLELLEIGAQRGLEGADALADYASFWDMVGDATGENGVALGKAGVALSALGIELGEEEKALDAFGFIMDSTTSDVGEFLTFIERTGPELRDMGLDIDQTAGLLGAMERELGMSGRMARQEFRKAVSQADGSLEDMLKNLGLTEEQFAEYTAAVGGNSDAIRLNADAFAATRTPMQRIQSEMADLLFRFPQVTDAAGLLAAPLAAIGPAAAGITHGVNALSMAKRGLIKLFKPMIAGFAKLAIAILTNPIFLIAAAVIALGVILFKFREEILEAIIGAWEWVKEATSAFWEWLKGAVTDGVEAVTDFFGNLRDRLVEIAGAIWQAIRNAFTTLLSFIRRTFDQIRDTVRRAMQTARDRAVDAVRGLFNSARNIFNDLLTFIRNIPSRIVSALGNLGNLLRGAGRAIIDGLLNGIKDSWKATRDFLSGLGSQIRNLKGPLSADRVLLEDIGEAIIGGLGRGMESEFRDVQRLLQGFTAQIPLNVDRDALSDVGAAAGVPIGGRGGGGQRIEVNVFNPTPEPASTSINRELRKLSAIGVFGAD